MSRRALVAKTYKLYLGGAFVRSESGRSDPATSHDGAHVANVPRSSRKDVRDAVKAARAAQAGWAKRTAYNRGQVLYRFAEALESRSAELSRGTDEIDQAVDLLVHYAGWTDNGAKAFEVASALRAGVVWQNTYNRFDPTAAFGGYKESRFGREGGPAGLLPYVRLT